MADSTEDYITVGSVGSTKFHLTLKLNSLSGVGRLFGDTVAAGPYWLSYKLFGVLVQTDAFDDLETAAFPPIHDVFRIRSTVQDLAAHLASLKPVQVYLCREGEVLGRAGLAVATLLSSEGAGTAPDFAEATITGGFGLEPLAPPDLAARFAAGDLAWADAMVNGVVSLARVVDAPQPAAAAPVPVPAASASMRSTGRASWVPPVAVVYGDMLGAALPAPAAAPPASSTPSPEVLAEVGRLRSDLVEARSVAEAASSAAAALQEQLAAGPSQSGPTQRAHDAVVADLRAAEADLETARATLRDLRQQVTRLEANQRDAAAESARADAAEADAVKLRAELEAGAEHMATARSTIRDLQHTVSDLEARLEREESRRAAAEGATATDSASREEATLDEASRHAHLASTAAANYEKLAARLRKVLAEAERRDHALKVAHKDVERTLATRLAEFELSKRHLQEEAEHLIRLERRRTQAVADDLNDSREELEATRSRERDLEATIRQLRDAELSGPNAELQHRLSVAHAENATLLRQIDALRADVNDAHAARDKTRAQMVRLARELARRRQEERERSDRAMEKLKVEYLARENKYVVDGERETLQDIRRELSDVLRGHAAQAAGGAAAAPSL